MIILSNFLIAAAKVIQIVLDFYFGLIFVRAVISWVNPDPYNVIVQFLYRTTEPVLQPIRRMLPPMGIDLSVLVVFMIIVFLKQFLVGSLLDFGYNLR